MKHIQLNNEYSAIVEDSDYEELIKYSWFAHKVGDKIYARNTKMAYMHRLITNASETAIVDHIDGNGLNNTKGNLRCCNKSQNGANRKGPNKNSRSKYLGVCLFKQTNKWQARVQKDGKYYHVGYFKNEDDAALAYNRKAKELFGEYAYENKVA
jgi:hypothetical protein